MPPPGFVELVSSPFVRHVGPLWVGGEPDRPVFGVTVAPEHANTLDTAHGGFVAVLIDVAATRGARAILGAPSALRTASASIDFMAPIDVGQWVTVTTAVDHTRKRTVYTSCRVEVGDALVARAQLVLVGS